MAQVVALGSYRSGGPTGDGFMWSKSSAERISGCSLKTLQRREQSGLSANEGGSLCREKENSFRRAVEGDAAISFSFGGGPCAPPVCEPATSGFRRLKVGAAQ